MVLGLAFVALAAFVAWASRAGDRKAEAMARAWADARQRTTLVVTREALEDVHLGDGEADLWMSRVQYVELTGEQDSEGYQGLLNGMRVWAYDDWRGPMRIVSPPPRRSDWHLDHRDPWAWETMDW
jgi:hypothetical protein